jgi:hypothetical protein
MLARNFCIILICSSWCLWSCASSAPKESGTVDRSRADRAFAELDGKDTRAEKPVEVSRDQTARMRVGGTPPVWVPIAPLDRSYYQGVGTATDGWQQARARALGDLASQIEVQVTSVVQSVIREGGYSAGGRGTSAVGSDFSSEVTLLTNQTITDYEIVEQWQGQGKYWVYVRLPQALVKEKLARELADARKLAVDHWSAGKSAEQKNDIVGAINSYVRGLAAVRKFLGQPIDADVNGRRVIINSELERDAGRLLRLIQLSPLSKTRIKARPGKSVNESLSIQVEYVGRPLPSVPIRFAFVKGAGQLVEQSATNREGVATTRIYKIDVGQTNNTIQGSIDLEQMTSLEADQLLGLRNQLDAIGVSSVLFFVSTAENRVVLDVDEENLGDRVVNSYLSSHLKDLIADKTGATFTEDRSQATVVLKGSVQSRFSSQMGNINFSYATAFVSLVDARTGEELYSTKLERIKGYHLDRAESGRKAIENATNQISDKVMQYMIRELGP